MGSVPYGSFILIYTDPDPFPPTAIYIFLNAREIGRIIDMNEVADILSCEKIIDHRSAAYVPRIQMIRSPTMAGSRWNVEAEIYSQYV